MANTQGRGPLGWITSRIAAKLILAMIFVAILPLALSGFVIRSNASRSITQQTEDSVTNLAANTADLVAQILIQNIHMLDALATSSALKNQLAAANASYQDGGGAAVALAEAIDARWRQAPDSDPLIRQALLADEVGNPSAYHASRFQEQFPSHVEVFTTDRVGALVGTTNRTSDYYQADEGWWQAAFAGGTGDAYVGTPELDESTGVLAVNLAVPIRDDAGDIEGILRSTVDIGTVLTVLEAARFGISGHLIIVDSDGNLLFDPQRPSAIGQDPGLGLTVTAESGSTEVAEVDGTRLLAGYGTPQRTGDLPVIKNLGWTTVALIERDEALAPVAAANLIAIFAGLGAAILAIIIAILLSRLLTRQLRFITGVLSRIGIGDLGARVEVVSQDETGDVAVGLNAMLDNIVSLVQTRDERDRVQASIMKLLDEVGGVAEGDLTREAEVTPEITGAIADSFNLMIGELRNIIGSVQETTRQVGSAATTVRTDMESLSGTSEAQAQTIRSASVAIGGLADSAKRVSEDAAGTAKVAEESVANARRGSAVVRQTIAGMDAIRAQVQETAKRIKRLGESSQEIGEIVQLISEIAERTSILALNASIQAASAGPAGRGFAVVAEEVEQLSERAAQSSKRIARLTNTIQAETKEAVTAMESTTREVVEGSEHANQAGAVLTEVGSVVDRLSELVQTISSRAQEQAASSTAVSSEMIQVSEATVRASEQTRKAALTVGSLAALADELRHSVDRFQLPPRSRQEVA